MTFTDGRLGDPMALLLQTPALTPSAAAEIARIFYGIEAAASSLPSERDQTFPAPDQRRDAARPEGCQRRRRAGAA